MTTSSINKKHKNSMFTPHHVYLRLTTLLLAVLIFLPSLTWTFDVANYTANQPGQLPVSHAGKILTIPEKYAHVQQSFQGHKKLVIHIQDLHCHYEVQKNIAGLIQHLADEYQLRLIGEEGAFHNVNLSKLRSFPMEQVRQEVADYFVRQGKLTGAEFYAATSKKTVNLVGIETPDLYHASEEAIKTFFNQASLGYCLDLREQMDVLKPGIYNAALAGFDKKWVAYRNNTMELTAYCSYLLKQAHHYNIELTPYPNIIGYMKVKAPLLGRQVDADQMVQEIENLNHVVRSRLYVNQREEELDGFYHRLDSIEKILNISATPQELEEFHHARSEFFIKHFIEFIQKHRTTDDYYLDQAVFELDEYLKTADYFYQLAKKRSSHFVKNLITKMDKQQEKIALMISGGFHTKEILEELEQRDYSYVSIKPVMTRQDMVNPYFRLLQNRETPLEKLLSKNQTIFSLRTTCPDGKFATEEVIFSKDIADPYQKSFAAWLEVMLESMAIVVMKTRGMASHLIADRIKEQLTAYPANEANIGVDMGKAFTERNQGLDSHGIMVIPTMLKDKAGQWVQNIAFWKQRLPEKIEQSSGTIQEEKIGDKHFLFVHSDASDPIVKELIAEENQQVNWQKIRSALARKVQQVVTAIKANQKQWTILGKGDTNKASFWEETFFLTLPFMLIALIKWMSTLGVNDLNLATWLNILRVSVVIFIGANVVAEWLGQVKKNNDMAWLPTGALAMSSIKPIQATDPTNFNSKNKNQDDFSKKKKKKKQAYPFPASAMILKLINPETRQAAIEDFEQNEELQSDVLKGLANSIGKETFSQPALEALIALGKKAYSLEVGQALKETRVAPEYQSLLTKARQKVLGEKPAPTDFAEARDAALAALQDILRDSDKVNLIYEETLKNSCKEMNGQGLHRANINKDKDDWKSHEILDLVRNLSMKIYNYEQAPKLYKSNSFQNYQDSVIKIGVLSAKLENKFFQAIYENGDLVLFKIMLRYYMPEAPNEVGAILDYYMTYLRIDIDDKGKQLVERLLDKWSRKRDQTINQVSFIKLFKEVVEKITELDSREKFRYQREITLVLTAFGLLETKYAVGIGGKTSPKSQNGSTAFAATALKGERQKTDPMQEARERINRIEPLAGSSLTTGDSEPLFAMVPDELNALAQALNMKAEEVGALADLSYQILKHEGVDVKALGTKRIMLALLARNRSEHLFEDHQANRLNLGKKHDYGFIGINGDFLKIVTRDKQLARYLLITGLVHELRHEAGITEERPAKDAELFFALMKADGLCEDAGKFDDVYNDYLDIINDYFSTAGFKQPINKIAKSVLARGKKNKAVESLHSILKVEKPVSNIKLDIDEIKKRLWTINKKMMVQYSQIDSRMVEKVSGLFNFGEVISDLIETKEYYGYNEAFLKMGLEKRLQQFGPVKPTQEMLERFYNYIGSPDAKEFVRLAAQYYLLYAMINYGEINGKLEPATLFGDDLVDDYVAKSRYVVDTMAGTLPLRMMRGLKKNRKYVFIDLSFFMTEVLRIAKNYMHISDEQMQIVEQDALNARFPRHSVSVMRLKNFETIVGARNLTDVWFDSVYQAIAPGGKLIINIPTMDEDIMDGDDIVRNVRQQFKWPYEVGYLSEDEQFFTKDRYEADMYDGDMATVFIFTRPQIGGKIPFVRNFFMRLGMKGWFYDRLFAPLPKNFLAWGLGVGSVMVWAALAGVGLDVSQIGYLGYIVAWPIFYALHAAKIGGERAPREDRIAAGVIALINLSLVATGWGPLELILASLIPHLVVNQAGALYQRLSNRVSATNVSKEKVMMETVTDQTGRQSDEKVYRSSEHVSQRTKWLDRVNFLRQSWLVLLASIVWLIDGRAWTNKEPLSVEKINQSHEIQNLKITHFPELDATVSRFTADQITFMNLTPDVGLLNYIRGLFWGYCSKTQVGPDKVEYQHVYLPAGVLKRVVESSQQDLGRYSSYQQLLDKLARNRLIQMIEHASLNRNDKIRRETERYTLKMHQTIQNQQPLAYQAAIVKGMPATLRNTPVVQEWLKEGSDIHRAYQGMTELSYQDQSQLLERQSEFAWTMIQFIRGQKPEDMDEQMNNIKAYSFIIKAIKSMALNQDESEQIHIAIAGSNAKETIALPVKFKKWQAGVLFDLVNALPFAVPEDGRKKFQPKHFKRFFRDAV